MAKPFFQLHQYQENGTCICNEVIGMFNLSIIARGSKHVYNFQY